MKNIDNPEYIPIRVSELDDIHRIQLDKLAEIIPILQKRYGKRAILEFDAGYNNIDVNCFPTKKEPLSD